MIAVMFEDRPTALTGVKLAVLSLARHSPALHVLIWAPGVGRPFLEWARGQLNVTVRDHRDGLAGEGWSVKPSVLLNAFDEGHDQVLWLDSDVILTGDVQGRLASAGPEAVVAAEEYFWGDHQGTAYRTTGLGLRPARTFPAAINTGLLRVSRQHVPLLRHWSRILAGPEYVAAQAQWDRPIHFFSDQEVLSGLLGSAGYADIPVVQLRRGAEIAQCFGASGFTVRERLRCGHSLPLAVHAMGRKPWDRRKRQANGAVARLRHAAERVHLDLTPYVAVARAYRDQLGEEAAWLEPGTRAGTVITRLLPGCPALWELPLTGLGSLGRKTRRTLRIDLDKVGSAPAPG